jgi:hypothetical protein
MARRCPQGFESHGRSEEPCGWPGLAPTHEQSRQQARNEKSPGRRTVRGLMIWWPRAESNHRHADFQAAPNLAPTMATRRTPRRNRSFAGDSGSLGSGLWLRFSYAVRRDVNSRIDLKPQTELRGDVLGLHRVVFHWGTTWSWASADPLNSRPATLAVCDGYVYKFGPGGDDGPDQVRGVR